MVRRRSWSVARYLTTIVVGVTLALAVLGGWAARTTMQQAEHDAATSARFQARLATRTLRDALDSARQQVVGLATQPGLDRVFEDPQACGLASGDGGVFQGGHLDLLAPDGAVACSSVVSRGAPAGASHAGAAWLRTTAKRAPKGGPATSAPFLDRLTGEMSVAIAAAAPTPGGGPTRLIVVAVAPVGRLDDGLGALLGGPADYHFEVVDSAGRVLSDPLGNRFSTTAQLRGPRWISGSSRIGPEGWRIDAAVDRATALAPTSALLWRAAGLSLIVLLVIFVSLAIVQRRIARPLRLLTRAIADASHGSARTPVPASGPTEVVQLASEFNEMVSLRNEYEEQLGHQALHDSLTGLPNRALLADRLAQALSQAGTPQAVGVVFIDLDQFKVVNDGLGHAVGDQVLRIQAIRLADSVRTRDTVARFGGDEFIVICTALTGTDDAVEVAAQLQDVISAPIELDGRTIRMTASIGIALGSAGDRADDLVQEADTAMYVSKSRGPGGFELFTSELQDRARGRLQIESQLRAAIEHGEVWLAYQPKIDLVTGSIVGAEALMRWDNPTLGAVPPATFIPIAEQTNLIGSLGRFAMVEAIRRAAAWRRAGFDLVVSVNLSAHQILDPGLTDFVARTLISEDLPGRALCLELTETALMADVGQAADVLDELHDLGVRISIDDFGTGYCSMAYLQQFPVDELKIDRAFVREITNDRSQHALVAAIIAMSSALEVRVVAEGIERLDQADALRLLECDYAQGFFFARPQPHEAVTALLREQARSAVNW
jgi:diguanylate cyclase (GGDEF)-like protein